MSTHRHTIWRRDNLVSRPVICARAKGAVHRSLLGSYMICRAGSKINPGNMHIPKRVFLSENRAIQVAYRSTAYALLIGIGASRHGELDAETTCRQGYFTLGALIGGFVRGVYSTGIDALRVPELICAGSKTARYTSGDDRPAGCNCNCAVQLPFRCQNSCAEVT